MTSNELKHQARTQEWGVAIQEICTGHGADGHSVG